MKPHYKVWYHPYKNPETVEVVESFATVEYEAKAFARAFGIPFKVEEIK